MARVAQLWPVRLLESLLYPFLQSPAWDSAVMAGATADLSVYALVRVGVRGWDPQEAEVEMEFMYQRLIREFF